MGFWITTAWKFLTRSIRSTAALWFMVVSAIATLIFLACLATGINDAMVRNSVSLFSGHITATDLPAALTTEDLRVAGTGAVLKRTRTQGLLVFHDRFETITLTGVDPEAEKKTTALAAKIVQGEFPKPLKSEILISRTTAQSLGIDAPGAAVSFVRSPGSDPVPLTVSGLFQTGIDGFDRTIALAPATAAGSGKGPWEAGIFLKPGVDPAAVLEQYRARGIETASFQTWEELMPDLKQLIDLNGISMGIVMALVLGVVSLGIACAFSIFILKNMREYGIMKAMGVTPAETASLVVSEVLLLNMAASIAGLLAGIAAVLAARETGIDLTAFTSHNRYFIVSGMIYPRLTPVSLLTAPLLSTAMSLVAAAWPVLMIARRQAVSLLRNF